MTQHSNDEPIVILDKDNTRITLLGTAHVSKASATTVKNLINRENFDLVAIELCQNRYNSIIDPDALTRIDIFDAIKNGKLPMITASLALGAFQQRIADQLGVEPGADMRAAVRAANERDISIALIDRDISTTFKRIYRSIPWYQRFKLFAALTASVFSSQKISEDEIEQLKHGDIIETSFNEFAEQDMDLFRPLIDERDQFMAAKLDAAIEEKQPKNILAVVGAGHLKGISKYIGSAKNPGKTITELNQIPATSKWPKYLPWIFIATILLIFSWVFYKDTKLGWDLAVSWVLYNGILSALGAAIATAHPLTILTAFISAPITSLIFGVTAGIPAAAVEAYLRHPHVRDFSELRHDASTVRGWWKNRVTRILLIFILCTIGSGLGFWLWLAFSKFTT